MESLSRYLVKVSAVAIFIAAQSLMLACSSSRAPDESAPVATDRVLVAQSDVLVTDQGVSTTIDVLANDSGLSDIPLTVTLVTLPSHGRASISPEGQISYTSDPNYLGPDNLSYQVTDSEGNIATASVGITVGCSSPPCMRTFRISWDPATHPDAAGYCVYHSVKPGPPYPDSHCVGNNTTAYNWTLPVVTGTDYFAIKTVDIDGAQSDFSEEATVVSF